MGAQIKSLKEKLEEFGIPAVPSEFTRKNVKRFIEKNISLEKQREKLEDKNLRV